LKWTQSTKFCLTVVSQKVKSFCLSLSGVSDRFCRIGGLDLFCGWARQRVTNRPIVHPPRHHSAFKAGKSGKDRHPENLSLPSVELGMR
jgi:hypothetical protein